MNEMLDLVFKILRLEKEKNEHLKALKVLTKHPQGITYTGSIHPNPYPHTDNDDRLCYLGVFKEMAGYGVLTYETKNEEKGKTFTYKINEKYEKAIKELLEWLKI